MPMRGRATLTEEAAKLVQKALTVVIKSTKVGEVLFMASSIAYDRTMKPSPQECDLASWAYFVSFASLGLGLPIPFLSLVAGIVFHLVQHRKSPFLAFHSWQALLLGLIPSLVVGVWSCWGLGVLFDYFLSAGNLVADLTAFWSLGIVSAALLSGEILLGLRAAAEAKRGEAVGFGPLGSFCRRLAFKL